jgi:hypothetical protein
MHFGTFPLLSGTPTMIEDRLSGSGIKVLAVSWGSYGRGPRLPHLAKRRPDMGHPLVGCWDRARWLLQHSTSVYCAIAV